VHDGSEHDLSRHAGAWPPGRQGLYDPAHEHDACGLGFIAHIKGRKSHAIIAQGLKILENLSHRGATGADPLQGDGAGILLQMPDRFLRRECAPLGIPLPAPGEYGCGLVFLPRETAQRHRVQALLHSIVEHEGQSLLGWRDVPTDDTLLGETARSVEPVIKQVFVARGTDVRDRQHFERKLYVVRKLFEKAVAAADVREQTFAYLPSLSCNTLIYKGMLSADQIESMYPDVTDPDVESALALGPHDRASFIADACNGDDVLLAEVESLLAQEAAASGMTAANPHAAITGAHRVRALDTLDRRLAHYVMHERTPAIRARLAGRRAAYLELADPEAFRQAINAAGGELTNIVQVQIFLVDSADAPV